MSDILDRLVTHFTLYSDFREALYESDPQMYFLLLGAAYRLPFSRKENS